MHVGDLLHTQPAELTGTHSAVHTVAAAIIGLHDVGTAARARFDLLCIFNITVNVSTLQNMGNALYSATKGLK